MITYNPFKDGKFWTLFVDGLYTLLTFFMGKYIPTIAEDIRIVWAVVQPIVALVIANMFVAQAQALKANVRVEYFKNFPILPETKDK